MRKYFSFLLFQIIPEVAKSVVHPVGTRNAQSEQSLVYTSDQVFLDVFFLQNLWLILKILPDCFCLFCLLFTVFASLDFVSGHLSWEWQGWKNSFSALFILGAFQGISMCSIFKYIGKMTDLSTAGLHRAFNRLMCSCQ